MMKKINFDEAKKLAEEWALFDLKDFRENKNIPLLSEFYLEAENCWFFFQNKQIKIPDESSMRKSSYAVNKLNKKCKGRIIGDYSNDPKFLHEYINKMSDYFARISSDEE